MLGGHEVVLGITAVATADQDQDGVGLRQRWVARDVEYRHRSNGVLLFIGGQSANLMRSSSKSTPASTRARTALFPRLTGASK